MTEQPDFWQKWQGDGSADKLPTKKKKKKAPRHNPWESTNMNPEEASKTTGP